MHTTIRRPQATSSHLDRAGQRRLTVGPAVRVTASAIWSPIVIVGFSEVIGS